MENTTSSKPRMYHIDGIKGILCFMIFWGHFWNIYRCGSEDFPFTTPFLDAIKDSILDQTLLSATFWLYAFLVISGYLVSNTRIRDFRELLIKSLKRFLRLFIPILGACFFIFIIQETIGFHTTDTANYFTNTYFQDFYTTDLQAGDIVKEAFKALFSSSCKFNAPFWVISDMFLSSIGIYICNYIDYIKEKKTHILPWLFLVAAILLDSHVIIACMAGYLVSYYREALEKFSEKLIPFFVVCISIFYVCYKLYKGAVNPMVFDKIFLYIILYCFLLILVNRLRPVQDFFSKKFFLLFGKISFGVYSFHWPIICSVGSLLLIVGLENQWNTNLILLASFGICLICTVLLSIIYHFTVEKLATKVTNLFK